jgi:EmrB/QacA subfamily drug resistance transporter
MSTRISALPTLLVASTGCAMTVLDTNIVAIVLPNIARDLNASFAQIEWVISAYVLCFASLLLPAGAIADRYGRKRVFLAGIAGFAIASLFCGLASSPSLLFIARALQGVGAAFLLAPALAIIGHAFHEERERDTAWAIWGGMMGLTMVLSPLLGGVIASLAGWRWAFFVNLPICLALAAATARCIVESRNEAACKLDPAGITLFAASMLGITSALIHGQEQGWTTVGTLARFAGGLVALTLFAFAETGHREPMLDLTLFRQRRFIGAILAMFSYAGCAQVMASLLPLLLQNGFALTALQAGGAMLAFALAMLIFPHVGRRLGARLAGYQILALGLGVVAAGNFLAAAGAYSMSLPFLFSGMFVLGTGGGLLNGETQKAIMGSVPPHRAGMASGISTTSRFSGILLGFAVLSGVLATSARGLLASANSSRPFSNAVVAGDLPRALAMIPAASRTSAGHMAQQAYSTGFATALMVAGVCSAVAAVIVLGLMRHRAIMAQAATNENAPKPLITDFRNSLPFK